MNNQDTSFYLSYSSKKAYTTCPKKYWFRYIEKDDAKQDPGPTIFGTTIGRIFEWFYNNRYWAKSDPVAETLNIVDIALDTTCDHESYVMSHHAKSEMINDLNACVFTTIEVIKKHKLLTPLSRAEVILNVTYNDFVFGGRADFIHGEENNIWIVDGKASRHREKYVDSGQLLWYCLQHYLKYHIVPSRLGFLYYKFPQDPVQWVSFTEMDLRQNLQETLNVISSIKLEKFNTKPSDECQRCPYKSKCDDGAKHTAMKRLMSGNRITESIFDLEAVHK